MKRIIFYFLLLTSNIILLSSCGAEPEFTSWPCRFIYDNSQHLDITLSSATNPAVPGMFCKITQETRVGARLFVFENNQGAQTTQPVTAEELRNNLRLGLNNGIIVGVQNFGGFTAYDLQCPNCVRKENNYASPNYQLIMDTKGSGIITCSKCKDKYDLNNGGLLVEGKEGDKGLSQYRNAYTQGANKMVTVFSE